MIISTFLSTEVLQGILALHGEFAEINATYISLVPSGQTVHPRLDKKLKIGTYYAIRDVNALP